MRDEIITITTMSDKTYRLPYPEQLWELKLEARLVDNDSGLAIGAPSRVTTVHVERIILERHGLLPKVDLVEPVVPKTPEDLIRELLVHLGVKFED